MLTTEQRLVKSDLELLMEVSAALAQQTQRAEDFSLIPAYLTNTLRLPRVTVAIVKTVADGSMILQSASTGDGVAEQDLLDIHQQTRPLSSQDGPTLRPTFELAMVDASEVDLRQAALRATVLAHSIDEKHRLLLVVHHAEDAHLDPHTTEILQLTARQLGKCLETQVIWATGPDALGEPFDRLTDREWMVLRGLNSDAGEKQLADQLGLSPHTLHSHIKSIYRKVGVQGRLPLLRRVDVAMRDYRLKGGSKSRIAEVTRSSNSVAAVG